MNSNENEPSKLIGLFMVVLLAACLWAAGLFDPRTYQSAKRHYFELKARFSGHHSPIQEKPPAVSLSMTPVPATAERVPTSSFPPLTLSEANALVKAGKYHELIRLLERDRQHATGKDLNRIDTMLSGLRKLAPPPPHPAASPVGFRLVNSVSSTKPVSQRIARVIALGGSKDGWFSALSFTDYYSSQQVVFQDTWPAAFIEQAWDDRYSITTVAGDARGWAVVLSRYTDGSFPSQSYWGPGPFGDDLQSWIASKYAEGKHITSVAGFGDHWVVIMTGGTGWGHQRFTRPGPYRNDWLAARLKEGYVITSSTGDRKTSGEGGITDTYLMVVTQGTGWTYQTRWANASKDEFDPWFREQTQTMAPVALFGHPLRRGAAFARGTRFSSGCGFFLGGGTQATADWLNNQGVGRSNP